MHRVDIDKVEVIRFAAVFAVIAAIGLIIAAFFVWPVLFKYAVVLAVVAGVGWFVVGLTYVVLESLAKEHCWRWWDRGKWPWEK